MRNNICTWNSCLDFTEIFQMCVEIWDTSTISNGHRAMSIPVDYGVTKSVSDYVQFLVESSYPADDISQVPFRNSNEWEWH